MECEHHCQIRFFQLVVSGSEHAKIKRVHPIRVQQTGRRGRPKKIVDPVWLADAVSSHRNITLQALADALGMHRNTLRNYLKLYGVYHRYSKISENDLGILTKHFKRVKPSSGLRYLIGFLQLMVLRSRKNRFANLFFVSMGLAGSFANTS